MKEKSELLTEIEELNEVKEQVQDLVRRFAFLEPQHFLDSESGRLFGAGRVLTIHYF